MKRALKVFQRTFPFTMKFCFKNVLLFILLPLFVPNHARAQIDMSLNETEPIPETKVVSSLFQMVLYPMSEKFNASATDKVKTIVKNLLFLSSSSSNDKFSFDFIKILVEGVTFESNYKLEESVTSISANNFAEKVNASVLEFKVEVALQMQHENSILPSQFSVDNMIVRTFSQPSTKSDFIDLIYQTMNPFLIEVEDIEIKLVEDPNENSSFEQAVSLSTIDIVLIITSSSIFFGIFYVLINQYDNQNYESIFRLTFFKRKAPLSATTDDNHTGERADTQSNENLKSQIAVGMMTNIEGNIEAASLDSSVGSQSQFVLSVIVESPAVSFASSSTSTSTSMSCLQMSSDKDSNDKESEVYASQAEGTQIRSEPIKFEHHHETKVLTNTRENLASKLLRLPGPESDTRSFTSNGINPSSSSAPTILEDIIREWMNESTRNEMIVKSSRSIAPVGNLEKGTERNVTDQRPSLYPFLKNRFRMNSFVMLETTEQFHKSWLEFQNKALEDNEEGSVDDVFQIDMHEVDALEEKEKRNSAKSVSEWMKLIEVVKSGSESQSSFENKSIESRSFHAREAYSIDLSLEDSMAKSLVNPEGK